MNIQTLKCDACGKTATGEPLGWYSVTNGQRYGSDTVMIQPWHVKISWSSVQRKEKFVEYDICSVECLQKHVASITASWVRWVNKRKRGKKAA
jgi:hypothetical protein